MPFKCSPENMWQEDLDYLNGPIKFVSLSSFLTSIFCPLLRLVKFLDQQLHNFLTQSTMYPWFWWSGITCIDNIYAIDELPNSFHWWKIFKSSPTRRGNTLTSLRKSLCWDSSESMARSKMLLDVALHQNALISQFQISVLWSLLMSHDHCCISQEKHMSIRWYICDVEDQSTYITITMGHAHHDRLSWKEKIKYIALIY